MTECAHTDDRNYCHICQCAQRDHVVTRLADALDGGLVTGPQVTSEFSGWLYCGHTVREGDPIVLADAGWICVTCGGGEAA